MSNAFEEILWYLQNVCFCVCACVYDNVAKASVARGYGCVSLANSVFTISVLMLSWQSCKHTCTQCSQCSCFIIVDRSADGQKQQVWSSHCFLLITLFSSMQSSVALVSACSGSRKSRRFTFIAPLDDHAAAFLDDFTAVWNYGGSRKTDVNLKVPGLNMWR